MMQLAETLKEAAPVSAASIFQQEWRLYRKIVDHNYAFHREAYGRLRLALDEDARRPFRFLDLACGDAASAVDALRGAEVASYCGVDLSAEALRLASRALAELPCPVSLRRGDFVEALAMRSEPVDVIWIGLSLHHLRRPAKLSAMRAARKLLHERGILLVYENTSPDGEDRDGWLRRWDLQEPDWTGLTADEWRRMTAHVRTYDFPETVSGWRDLGQEAGFGSVRELFVAPGDLFRLFGFRP
jgi:SAM-dependent methyltransferase